MKTTFALVLIALSSVATVAHSQIGPGDRLGLEPGPDTPSPGRTSQAGTNPGWIDSFGGNQIPTHAKSCAERYRSYKPEFGTYTRYDGSRGTCP